MSGHCCVSVHVLADRPHLCEAIGEIRWQERGAEPGFGDLSWWVEVTRREAGRQQLPVTWVAVAAGPGQTVILTRRLPSHRSLTD